MEEKNVAFWHDVWAGECSLKTKFWGLLLIFRQQESPMARVCNVSELMYLLEDV